MKDCKPSPLAGGLAFGILRGVSAVFIGIAGNFREQCASIVNIIGQFYIGYSLTIGGILLGFLWAFTDAFLGVLILLWLYNIIYKWIKK